jgi:hypothetical protein
MAVPRKIKPTLPLVPKKELYPRREQLLEFIQKDGTYLPKSILHADLDRGMLDFVKEELKLYSDGKVVPSIDIIVTTQNWAQFTETWNFQDLNGNVLPPFITTVRQPEVKYGSNPALFYNIPNRKEFVYAKVPTWDGTRKGVDIYKIPQPVPIDITYNVKLVCNRMRELNSFNKTVMQTFASRQAYTFIKGHYVPIILDNVSDESEMSVDKRKYYVQTYTFTMLGFLIDEEEFEVAPGITRALTMVEVASRTGARRAKGQPPRPNNFDLDFRYSGETTSISETFRYTANLIVNNSNNVESFSVYFNDLYVGDDVYNIQVTSGDVVRIEVVKIEPGEFANIEVKAFLV